MQQTQLYIDGQRVEMLEETSVVITDTLKDVRDVSKVFTEYSQTFSVPASKTNNKIFKHYYNSDITNGFDSRIKVASKLELNSIPFKSGYIKLEGVDLRNNSPYIYRITFFGNTVSLKDLLGDDLLGSLSWLDNFSTKQNGNLLNNSTADIEQYLTTNLNKTVDGVVYVNPVQVPLITHTQRLYYDSAEDIADNGNVHYNATVGANFIHGVKFNELKYALKLSVIIKAIEERYGIVFSDDFFKGGDSSFDDLYMWLHRVKGKITSGGQVEVSVFPVRTFTNDFSNSGSNMNFNILTITDDPLFRNQALSLSLTVAAGFTTIPYSITVFRNGLTAYSASNITGTQNDIPIPVSDGSEYTIQISTAEAINFTSATWNYTYRDGGGGFPEEIYISGSFSITVGNFDFNITQQIPKMKVLDFLTAIFKMFNLIAYVDGTQMVVDTLDNYQNKGRGGSLSTEESWDITKYIDVSNSQSNSVLPFREVIFEYEGLGTFLAERHNQLFNEDWGTEQYNEEGNLIFNGDIYNYKVPFEHLKFERLLNISQINPPTDVQWGFCVDNNQDSYIGKPIIFYLARKSASISYVNAVNSDNVAQSRLEILNYFAPASSNLSLPNFLDRQSINFSPESDEWELTPNYNSLFNNYHINYISGVFNKSNRLTKMTAFLPLRILLRYGLNDRFVVAGKSYKINSVETDLQSGKSQLELLADY